MSKRTYDNPPKHDPSPEEIREKCLEYQATWDDAERERRCVGPNKRKGWEVPEVRKVK